jgi:hypothetical protein
MLTEYLLPDKSPASVLNFAHATCVAPGAKVWGTTGLMEPPSTAGRDLLPVCSSISCQSSQENFAGWEPVFRNVTSAVMRLPACTNLVSSAATPVTLVSCWEGCDGAVLRLRPGSLAK